MTSKYPSIGVIDPRRYSRVPMAEVPADAPTITLEQYWDLCNTARRDAWLAKQDLGAIKQEFEHAYPVRTARDSYGIKGVIPYQRNDLKGGQ